MTAQQVFDKVARHLLKQNKKSLIQSGAGATCAYRGNDGLMCAVGCLIPDDQYNPGMELLPVTSLVLRHGGLPVICDVIAPHAYLLDELQDVHDREEPELWRKGLLAVAAEFELDVGVLQT